MSLALRPPIAPMLAQLVRELPDGDDYMFEPKWDGFRCMVFRDGDAIDLRSRNQKPFARYFPELVECLRELPGEFAIDGEILASKDGQTDFSALLQRLHPADTRVAMLRRETPACFIAFDALAVGGRDLMQAPFSERREHLEALLGAGGPHLRVTPTSDDPEVANEWLEHGDGIDGVIARRASGIYEPGRRALVKVKRERTADCVVAGFRWHHDAPLVGSLLLGAYDDGVLRHVGLASSFRAEKRKELLDAVTPYITELGGHPWERGFNIAAGPVGRLPGAASAWVEDGQLTWIPLDPRLVCEVAYEHLELKRFRHPARFRRWRPDRDPASCTYEQFERAAAPLP